MFISPVTDMLGINHATLSGAIDIIVVKQPDGSFKSSPFHVRFGKMKILTPNGKLVSISVNGGETKLKMTLDVEGQGFFMPDSSTIPSS